MGGIIIFFVSLIWLIAYPGFEPLVGFLASAIAFFGSSQFDDENLRNDPAQIKQRADSQRDAMLKQVQKYFVENVLDSSLHDAIVHELELTHKPDIIQNAHGIVLKNAGKKPLKTDADIAELFEEAEGRLLITGEPGGGKTTTMLRLARHLIPHALADKGKPIPTIFNLAEWSQKREDLNIWMASVLQEKYRAPEEVATYWIDENEILPLLDGLDEVPAEHRAECIKKINDYGASGVNIALIVCSRREEYEKLVIDNTDNRLNMGGSIQLDLLTQEQIIHFLDDLGEKTAALRAFLSQDEQLLDIAKTPLLLNMMVLAYEGQIIDSEATSSTEERRSHLFDTYIQRRFETKDIKDQRYTKESTLKWLSWLAWQMNGRNLTEFKIEELQPWWLPNERQINRYKADISLVFTLVFGLSSGIAFGFAVGLAGLLALDILFGLKVGISFGLAVGILFGSFAERYVKLNIKPVSALIWRWNSYAVQRFAFGFAVGITVSLVLSFPFGLVFGLTRGLAIGFAGGLALALGELLVPEEINQSQHTNEGILRSWKTGWLRFWILVPIFFIAGAGMGISEAVIQGKTAWTSALIPIFIFGIPISLGFSAFWGLRDGEGWNAVLKHKILRRMLFKEDQIPIYTEYADFLFYASELRLLVPVGGGFKFMHGLLQDHFADIYIKANPDAEIIPDPDKLNKDLEKHVTLVVELAKKLEMLSQDIAAIFEEVKLVQKKYPKEFSQAVTILDQQSNAETDNLIETANKLIRLVEDDMDQFNHTSILASLTRLTNLVEQSTLASKKLQHLTVDKQRIEKILASLGEKPRNYKL